MFVEYLVRLVVTPDRRGYLKRRWVEPATVVVPPLQGWHFVGIEKMGLLLHEGELQELGEVSNLLRVSDHLELRARGVQPTPELRRDLEEVLRKHGGQLETIGHPTTTLEELFLRIVEESKAHPGRRYLPGGERVSDQTAREAVQRADGVVKAADPAAAQHIKEQR